VLEKLAPHFNISLYYYNPNIHGEGEYRKRFQALSGLVKNFQRRPGATSIELYDEASHEGEYYDAVRTRKEVALQKEAEGGRRCERCYRFRLERSFAYALDNGFDWVCSTLTISPHKDAQVINALGAELEKKYYDLWYNLDDDAPSKGLHAPRWLASDFKKEGGYQRSVELSKEYGLYRQDFCGCEYSLAEAQARHLEAEKRRAIEESERQGRLVTLEEVIRTADEYRAGERERTLKRLQEKDLDRLFNQRGQKRDKERRQRKEKR
jgi:predicted adenine nucleotide alpha hydrolase (AANH) superfamily ATPase